MGWFSRFVVGVSKTPRVVNQAVAVAGGIVKDVAIPVTFAGLAYEVGKDTGSSASGDAVGEFGAGVNVVDGFKAIIVGEGIGMATAFTTRLFEKKGEVVSGVLIPAAAIAGSAAVIEGYGNPHFAPTMFFGVFMASSVLAGQRAQNALEAIKKLNLEATDYQQQKNVLIKTVMDNSVYCLGSAGTAACVVLGLGAAAVAPAVASGALVGACALTAATGFYKTGRMVYDSATVKEGYLNRFGHWATSCCCRGGEDKKPLLIPETTSTDITPPGSASATVNAAV